MLSRNFILATAGHVDHGKSALIKALTGTDPDRLPEEKARGITIDLGFAHLELPAPAEAAPVSSFSVGIVDVPGHEDFVKNMVAGVGSVDVALLIVAADDGWMPQTEEHLQILSYLGIRQGVVALTKIDLASVSEETIRAELRERLRNSPLAEAPIVATSVVTGRGLEELKLTLARVLSSLPAAPDLGKPRLPVDRVFTLQGIGTVVTGTLTGGVLQRGQAVVVQPSGQTARIRGLQNFNRDAEQSVPGTRTAINLPDLVSGGKGHHAVEEHRVRRGDVITLASLGSSSTTVDVLLQKSARLAGAKTISARPLKDGALVRVHHGSGHAPGRVLLLEGNALEAGGRLLAQLRFEEPVFYLAGDRFILRDWAEQWTLGGGIVLDPNATREHVRSEERLTFLRARATDDLAVLAYVSSQIKRDRSVRGDGLLRQSIFSQRDIDQAVERLAAERVAVRAGEWLLEATWWGGLRERAEAMIRAEHEHHPERPGLALNELRSALAGQWPGMDLFPLLLGALQQRGFVQVGTAIRHVAHRPALPPHLQAAGERLRAALQAKPFEPPTKKDLLAIPQALQALRFFIETGEAVELSEDTVLAADALARATVLIKSHLRYKKGATASELRQLLQTNRRVIIPLLERLDKEGVTLRQGDQRVLRSP